jgi:hypothetical protein
MAKKIIWTTWRRWFTTICGWLVFIGWAGFCLYVVWSQLIIGETARLFINAKFMQILMMTTSVMFPIFVLDWITRGQTILTILNIDENSESDEKFIAATFLLGVAFVLAYALRGQF